MGSLLKLNVILNFSILMCNTGVFAHLLENVSEDRVKRQAGYVYDKPSISFNLPTRTPSTVSTTQATTVNRPQEQQMYYAYPVPAGGDTVNIGFSTTGSTSSSGVSTTTSTSGSTTGGYNYGTQTTSTSTLGSISTGANTGYNYNTPTSTTKPGSTADSVSPTGSTNAPKYLPPTSGGYSGSSGGVSISGSSGGSTSPSVSTATQTSTSGVSFPNTSYLPPLPNQSPLPGTSPGPSPTPGTPSASTAGYLPPSVPTPAATYLPPVL